MVAVAQSLKATQNLSFPLAYLMVLEEEEGLDEGEDQVDDVDESEDVRLARGRVLCLEVGGDVKAVQSHAANAEGCKTQESRCSSSGQKTTSFHYLHYRRRHGHSRRTLIFCRDTLSFTGILVARSIKWYLRLTVGI